MTGFGRLVSRLEEVTQPPPPKAGIVQVCVRGAEELSTKQLGTRPWKERMAVTSPAKSLLHFRR